MATDDEILKALNRIEQVLKGASPTAGLGRAPRVAGGAEPPEDKGAAKTFKATVAGFTSLNDASAKLTKSFTGLSKTVLITRENFVQMNRSMRAYAKAAPTIGAGAARVPPVPAGGGGGTGGGGGGGIVPPAGNPAAPLLSTFTSVKLGLIGVLASLKGAIEPVVKDFFELHARGIDATSSLGGLYMDAIRAGMSLKDYTDLLEKAGPAVVRATNFREFNDRLMATTKQLEPLGVFGDDAAKLSATLANSATVLGVPQSQLADATTRQVAIFAELRKTTMMTADQFAKLTAGLEDNENVQGELLGLARSERPARLAELQKTNLIGDAMGLTTKASRALGDALLEQRKLTVEQRFQVAGGIRQMGGFAGLDPGEVETLARLAGKKNLSTEEKKLFVDLGGRFKEGQEALANSNEVNSQLIEERMGKVTEAIAPSLKAAGQALLTQQSKEVTPKTANEQFGQGASDLVKGAGMLLSFAKGIQENPLAKGLAAVIGSVAFTVGVGTVIGKVAGPIIAAAVAAAGLGGAAGGVPGPGGAGAGARTGFWGKTVGFLGKAVGVLATGLPVILNSVDSIGKYDEAKKMDDKEAGAIQEGEAIGQGIGGAVGAGVGIALSGFVDTITGGLGAWTNPFIIALTTGLGAWAGSWFGGWLKKDKATDKNTEAVKASTAALKTQQEGINNLNGTVMTSTDNLATTLIGSTKTIYDAGQPKPEDAKADATKTEAVKEQTSAFDKAMQAFSGAYIETTPPKPKTEEIKETGPTAFDKVMQAFSSGYVEFGGVQPPIATPGQTVRPTVTPPAVNTPEPVPPPVSGTPGAPVATITTPDLVTQLTTMIALLQQTLDVEKIHAGFTEAILRASGRTQFADTDRMIDQVLRPRLT